MFRLDTTSIETYNSVNSVPHTTLTQLNYPHSVDPSAK